MFCYFASGRPTRASVSAPRADAVNDVGDCEARALALALASGLRLPVTLSTNSGNAYARRTAHPTCSLTTDLQDGRTREQLKSGIAGFYDASSGVWERVWGEHMHHGYYGPTGGEPKDHQQAQVDMVDESLKWAGVDEKPPKRILDVGCGIGGSSRHIAAKYGKDTVTGVGITLSPVHAARASTISADQGFGIGFSSAWPTRR